MTNYLTRHATTTEACEWLATETGGKWTLARLLEHGLMPWVWLDYTPGLPAIFGDRIEGYLAPLIFGGDTQRLAVVGTDALITMTRTDDGKLIRMTPGLRVSIDELRFLRDDIARLAGKHSVPHDMPAAKGEAVLVASQGGEVEVRPDNHDETLAALFDPVRVETLEKMFPTTNKKWRGWTERAKTNGLINARPRRAVFNPYKAGMWFVENGAAGWDIARLYKTLSKNLPPRSHDSTHLFTWGED